MSWLTSTIALGLRFAAAQMSRTSARSASAVSASTWLNGSSMKSSSGSRESARAMPTRCFIPPESSRG